MNRTLVDRFCDHLWLEDGLAKLTLAAYRTDLTHFGKWLEKERKLILNAAVPGDVEAYLAWRFNQHAQPRSAARYTSTLKRFYRYLLRENLIAADPTLNLDSPKLPRSLPKTLTEDDVERLLDNADTNTPLGLRDRAMLETLYATGLRVSELVGLKLTAVNVNDGVLRVTGKGNKDRLVPLGEESVQCLRRYLAESRPLLLHRQLCDEIFVTARGAGMTRQAFWYLIKRHALAAGITRPLSPHTLRHAFA
ncbi:MAG: site-specific tyrosine recombinase XerD, partial [Sulfuriferula multivorans]|nr:site-specific tyrosine recombinase XerD [Sulfuriferula multivorans]